MASIQLSKGLLLANLILDEFTVMTLQNISLQIGITVKYKLGNYFSVHGFIRKFRYLFITISLIELGPYKSVSAKLQR